MSHYQFKQSFVNDPTRKARVFDLLEICFPGMTQAEDSSLGLGRPWEMVSTPFVYWHGDWLLPMLGCWRFLWWSWDRRCGWADSRRWHASRYRRRGYYRAVMAEVLQYCAPRYDTLLLTTGQPVLYEPFGFRVLQEHLLHRTVCQQWRAARVAAAPSPGCPGFPGV